MVRFNKGPAPSGAKPLARPPKPSQFGSTQNMSANIKVVVRVRPLNDKEKELNNRVVVDVVDDRMLVFDPKEELLPFFYQGVQQPNKGFLKRANKELKFVFDYVCDMNATNDVVFETTTKDMLSSLMEGYNCSVFVYGATGAGKTFTMIGNINNPGITYLTMEHLFCLMNSLENDRVFEIGVSYIEVYNENVYDLLKPSNVPLQLREDNKYGVVVAGLTINTIKTARELLNMLENGNKNRTQHPTDANAESSRSHAVFQVFLKMSYKTSGQQRIVKLSMIDLAGSERASATGCVGDRFKEGANINKSLLSLGNCINKLADGSNYIPYRDSKLTRLLKDSLGGNCKTVMIANISPSSISYEDTYNTLKYAARASKIQLTIKKNIVDGDMRVSQYVRINEELKKKIKELEAKLSISETRPVKVSSKEVEASMEKAMQEWQRQIDAAEEEVATAETELLDVMSRARVLALRRRLRTRAARDYADLAHRSSYTHMHELVSEELSRRTRSSALQARAARALDVRVRSAAESRARAARRLRSLLDRALAACPALAAAVRAVHLRREIRLLRARDELRYKLLSIENAEITMITEYLSDMPSMLKKLYLTLKGYDKVPPSLTQEYLEVMKKSKAKGITWSDDDNECDTHFKFIANLDLDNPGLLSDIDFRDDNSIDLDSEDLTDTESRDTENNVNIDSKKVFDDRIDTENRMDKENCPDEEHRLETLVTKHIDSMKKRKGTPIKLTNNETIVINDSFELLDTTRNMNSAKKAKIESNEDIDVNNLNSTFVMAGKVEPLKQNIKVEKETAPVRRPLTDGTNTMNRDHRTVHFAEKARAAKPVVGRALPLRRPGARGAGFGSSLSRDGTPFARPGAQEARDKAHVTQRSVGLKAVRGRERAHHPYSRPAPAARR